jgi:hypothetical protein
MPLMFASAIAVFYVPYAITSKTSVLGYLPGYFRETFNISPFVSMLNHFLDGIHLILPYRLVAMSLGAILVTAIWCIFHPAPDAETALRRCIWPIGLVTLFSQDLFAWYMLWLLPLIAIFLWPSTIKLNMLSLPKIDAWTGWWLFCGLVGLSYTFFIKWRPVDFAIQVEFLPLYLILFANLIIELWKKFSTDFEPTSIQRSSS